MRPINLLFLSFAFIILTRPLSLAQVQHHVSWTFSPKKTSATIGEVIELQFNARIDENWYLYSSDFDPNLGPILTTAAFKPSDAYQLLGKLTPGAGVKEKFEEVWNGKVRYFLHEASFTQKIKILTPNPVIEGTLDYQTCSTKDGLCVNGTTEFLFNTIKVAAATPAIDLTTHDSTHKPTSASATTPTANADKKESSVLVTTSVDSATTWQVETTASESTTKTGPLPSAQKIKQQPLSDQPDSLWGFLVAAFLSGLIALLTPCVFPIIPMTVSYFTKQDHGPWKALLYGVSIIGIYVLLGTLVSRINGPAFANFVSTHWFPNLLFFAVFFVFGLSFLGLFEIVLPNSLINKADARAEKGGIGGIIFMAFTLVLVSFSCTGPIVGSLLVASAGGEVVKPIVGMAAFSAAFAIPFTLFAAFPQWLKSLPKSGGWLNSVKVVLGFIELALALKFLSIADQVYHWKLLDREVFLAFWIVIFSLIGFYLLGKIRLPHDNEVKTISIPRLLLTILTFAFVVYLIPGLWGAPLKALSGYLPPETTQDFNLTSNRTATVLAESPLRERPRHADLFRLPHGLQGFFDYQQALAYARQVNKPVFIDFTGHGCVNCREMEARVWSEEPVLKRLQYDYVVVALYIDDKTELPESDWYVSAYDGKQKKTIGAQNADLQIVKYNNNAQPHYCLVDHTGKLLVQPKNYDRNVEHFTAFLDSGLKVFHNRTAQR